MHEQSRSANENDLIRSPDATGRSGMIIPLTAIEGTSGFSSSSETAFLTSILAPCRPRLLAIMSAPLRSWGSVTVPKLPGYPLDLFGRSWRDFRGSFFPEPCGSLATVATVDSAPCYNGILWPPAAPQNTTGTSSSTGQSAFHQFEQLEPILRSLIVQKLKPRWLKRGKRRIDLDPGRKIGSRNEHAF
jgi:hypothetical protein